jgi:hypothetical protein
MELFLNLCWLSLLLPACLLWRSRTFSGGSSRLSGGPLASRLAFLCVLGCALVLLFPVISASDDLHAMRPEMEESERAFRHAGHCACAAHALTHSSQQVSPWAVSYAPTFDQLGSVFVFVPETLEASSLLTSAGRAPPPARSLMLS